MLIKQVIQTLRGASRPNAAQREQLLLRVERAGELPLLLLAFLMIPLIAGPFLWDLSSGEIALLSVLNMVIWIVFAIDLIVKVAITTNRVAYLRTHWVDVLIVAIPFFRPLRILRLAIYGSRAFQGSRRLSRTDFIVVYAFGALIIATTVIVAFERNVEGSRLGEFPDALWWGVVTVTTVGYGDITPVSVGGRIVAAALMLVGIGLFSFLTANVASKLARDDQVTREHATSELSSDVVDELESLKLEVRRLTAVVEGLASANKRP